jgi:UDP-glucose 4-epimerase
MTRKILVTGGTGFVGKGVLNRLIHGSDCAVVATVRSSNATLPARVSVISMTGLGADADWLPALGGVDVVVHCAARVHVMKERAGDPLMIFRQVNVEGTLALARQAAAAGVRRFVFLSSIKVNGESTVIAHPFTPDDSPSPTDPYGVSKMEAENGLRALASETGMEVVIIRPVLVYGPGVKANFLSMMRWLNKGVPLPLGAIHNKRSLVALDNLVDLIVTCISHPAAANQTFLVSDGEDLSTTDLLRRMSLALGKSARLFPVPAWFIKGAAALLGKQAVVQRLCGSLQVDISKTCTLLGWEPPVSVDEALRKTATHFLQEQGR